MLRDITIIVHDLRPLWSQRIRLNHCPCFVYFSMPEYHVTKCRILQVNSFPRYIERLHWTYIQLCVNFFWRELKLAPFPRPSQAHTMLPTLNTGHVAAHHPQEPRTNPIQAVTAQAPPLNACTSEYSVVNDDRLWCTVPPGKVYWSSRSAGLRARPVAPCTADRSCGREAGPKLPGGRLG